jgi:1,4-alpha-glucan branching enzyme
MAKLGAFTFVLHSHLPYCRRAGRWPHGEEWIHEAAAETYIPLLNVLYDLLDEGVKPRLTIGITPILTEQLADPDIVAHFQEYLLEKTAAAEKDIVRLEALATAADRAAAEEAVAAVEQTRVAGLDTAVEQRSAEAITELEQREAAHTAVGASTVPGVPAALPPADNPTVAATASLTEPTLAPAPDTTAKAPRVDVPAAAIASQIVSEAEEAPVEIDVVVAPPEPPDPHRLFLARWYRDWYTATLRSFTERFSSDIVGAFKHLQDIGAIEIITSMATHCYSPLVARDSTLYGQLAVGIASYERHYGRKPRAIWLPECAYRPGYIDEQSGVQKPGVEAFLAAQGIGCFFAETHMVEGGRPVGKALDAAIGPYGAIRRRYTVPIPDYVEPADRTTYRPYYVAGTEVAVIGRNDQTGSQVWSGAQGYPGDANYREFHKKDSFSGMQYWRVSGPKIELGDKDYWHPDWAEGSVHNHVEARTDTFGLISSNYDTELFGHWWFEGVAWLKGVLRGLARSEVVELTTASDFLAEHPPEEVVMLPEGSWGSGGTHLTWKNPDNEWMWPLIHNAERDMEQLVAGYPSAEDDEAFVLQQIARELVLLESSDWPFLISTGQAREYSEGRFAEHMARFHRLTAALAGGNTPEARQLAEQYYELDNPFSTIDYRVFAEREGRPQ